MNLLNKRQNLVKILVIIASVALLLTTFIPFLTYIFQ